jgi:hypothetical protein
MGDKSWRFGNVVVHGMEVTVACCAGDGAGSGDECLEGLVGVGSGNLLAFEAYNGVKNRSNFVVMIFVW